MSSTRDAFKDDLHRDPGELESEADRAREHLEHTLQALERRLSPGELLDQALRIVRGNGSEFGHNLAVQVRNNPVPVLLTGVGVTWLVAASSRPPTPGMENRSGLLDRASEVAGSARDAARATASGTSSAVGSARETAASARSAVGHAASRTAAATRRATEGTRHAAESVASASSTGARRAREGFDYLRTEQPLVLGALAVALGALIGAVMPSTRAEDRLMGKHSAQATDRISEEAQRKAEEAGETATRAMRAAADRGADSDESGPAFAGSSASGSASGGSARGDVQRKGPIGPGTSTADVTAPGSTRSDPADPASGSGGAPV